MARSTASESLMVDAARQRKAEEPHGFLPVDQEDHPRITLTFQERDLAAAHGILPALPQHRLKSGEHELAPASRIAAVGISSLPTSTTKLHAKGKTIKA